jgi:heme O synthase-like polyprenyltransferase
MLPVHTTPRQAAWFVMAHTFPTCLAGLFLVVIPPLGLAYFIPVLWVTVDLFWRNTKLIKDPSPVNARAMFMSSNIYLLVLLLAICLGTVVANLFNSIL